MQMESRSDVIRAQVPRLTLKDHHHNQVWQVLVAVQSKTPYDELEPTVQQQVTEPLLNY